MGVGRQFLLAAFLVGALAGPCHAGRVGLETKPWPPTRNCGACIAVQFGKLEMRLSPADFGKLLVIGAGDSVLHVLPKSGDPSKSMMFMSVSRDQLLGKYESAGLLKSLGITSYQQFFDALGKDPGGDPALTKIQDIEGIDTADSYVKIAKDSVQVYWIRSSKPSLSAAYFLVGDDLYWLTGEVTQEFYEAVLANLRIVNVP